MDGLEQTSGRAVRLSVSEMQQMRRASADSQASRSRRGSSEFSARLEVDIRSRVLNPATPHGPLSPSPYPPCFSGDITEDLEAQPDDKVTISCAVHGHPRPEVAWHKDGVLLLQNSLGIELWSHAHEHKLVIPYVDYDHAGVYCIVAVNPLGRSECHCVLRVVDEPDDSGPEDPTQPRHPDNDVATTALVVCRRPPEFRSLFRDRRCRIGDPVTFDCEIEAWPEPLVTWSFNGRPISDADPEFLATNQERRHQLRLLGGAAQRHSGRISLTAENEFGVASCGALLIVEDPTNGRICDKKVIRAATKLFNKRQEKPTEAWQTTPSYSLMA